MTNSTSVSTRQGNTAIPLSRPALDASDIQAVVDVLHSGWITSGARVAELESIICQQLSCKHAVALSSATAGMQLALHALGAGPGDEVITPSLTWVSTPNMIQLCGATPVFVDVDRDTLMTTAELIEPKITERTKAIVPVHFAGAPLDLAPMRALAHRHSIALIEDAAHALGTRYGEEHVGKKGTAIFSFHPLKNVTSGEGGMFCTDDDELAGRIRRLRFHGLAMDAFERARSGRAPQAEVVEPGFKFNLPDMNAALALGQLRRLDSLNRRRRQLARRYDECFEDMDEVCPLAMPAYPCLHARHLYVVRLNATPGTLHRDDLMSALSRSGIGTGLHFKAVHSQAFYRDRYETSEDELPNTVWNSERVCSLPLYPDMTHDDVRRVIDSIKAVLHRAAA